MKLDGPALIRLGQALNTCYQPLFRDRPERVTFPSPHSVLWGQDSDGPAPYGVSYLDPVLGAHVVLIRGTDSLAEWISDFTATMTPCPFMEGARTHLGFTGVYQTLRLGRNPVHAALIDLQRPVIVTGHSLGAALATLVAAAVGTVDLVTWAGPRVGDDAFAHTAMMRLSSNTRIVNCRDIVPKVPLRVEPAFRYEHLGWPLELDSGDTTGGSLGHAHSLDTYLDLMGKLSKLTASDP